MFRLSARRAIFGAAIGRFQLAQQLRPTNATIRHIHTNKQLHNVEPVETNASESVPTHPSSSDVPFDPVDSDYPPSSSSSSSSFVPRTRRPGSHVNNPPLRSLLDALAHITTRFMEIARQKAPSKSLKKERQQLQSYADSILKQLFSLEAFSPITPENRLHSRDFRNIFFLIKQQGLYSKSYPFFQLMQLHLQLRWKEFEDRIEVLKSDPQWGVQAVSDEKRRMSYVGANARVIGLILETIALSPDHGPQSAVIALQWMADPVRASSFEVLPSHYGIILRSFSTSPKRTSSGDITPEWLTQASSFFEQIPELQRQPWTWKSFIRLLLDANQFQKAIQVQTELEQAIKDGRVITTSRADEMNLTQSSESTGRFASSTPYNPLAAQPPYRTVLRDSYMDVLRAFVDYDSTLAKSGLTPDHPTRAQLFLDATDFHSNQFPRSSRTSISYGLFGTLAKLHDSDALAKDAALKAQRARETGLDELQAPPPIHAHQSLEVLFELFQKVRTTNPKEKDLLKGLMASIQDLWNERKSNHRLTAQHLKMILDTYALLGAIEPSYQSAVDTINQERRSLRSWIQLQQKNARLRLQAREHVGGTGMTDVVVEAPPTYVAKESSINAVLLRMIQSLGSGVGVWLDEASILWSVWLKLQRLRIEAEKIAGNNGVNQLATKTDEEQAPVMETYISLLNKAHLENSREKVIALWDSVDSTARAASPRLLATYLRATCTPDAVGISRASSLVSDWCTSGGRLSSPKSLTIFVAWLELFVPTANIQEAEQVWIRMVMDHGRMPTSSTYARFIMTFVSADLQLASQNIPLTGRKFPIQPLFDAMFVAGLKFTPPDLDFMVNQTAKIAASLPSGAVLDECRFYWMGKWLRTVHLTVAHMSIMESTKQTLRAYREEFHRRPFEKMSEEKQKERQEFIDAINATIERNTTTQQELVQLEDLQEN